MSNPFNEDENDDHANPKNKPAPRGRLLFVVFLLLIILVGFGGGYLIRVYYKSSESAAPSVSGNSGGAFNEIKEQWREHRLPLDVKSLSAMWAGMKDDLEKEKLPQLKEKLETLKAQIEEKKNSAKPELEAEWQKLSEKVDGLMATVQEKRDDWAEKFSDVQKETLQLLEKESEKLDAPSPTPVNESNH